MNKIKLVLEFVVYIYFSFCAWLLSDLLQNDKILKNYYDIGIVLLGLMLLIYIFYKHIKYNWIMIGLIWVTPIFLTLVNIVHIGMR